MTDSSYVVIDKIKWFVYKVNDVRIPQPLCPEHHLRLRHVESREYDASLRRMVSRGESGATQLKCAEGHRIDLPRTYYEEKQYVLDRIDAVTFANVTYMYLDDIAVPVAVENTKSKDSPIWVRTKVTESKTGLRLIVWAGDRSKKNKAQLFIDPTVKRLGFDQNDDHPMEVFTRGAATFADDVRAIIDKNKDTDK